MSQPVKWVTETEEHPLETVNQQSVSIRDGDTLQLHIHRSHDGLSIAADDQPLTLTISMGPQGPQVELSQANLKIKSTERLELEAEHLALTGHQSCTLETDGGLELKAKGELELKSKRDCVIKADVIHLK